MAIISIQHPVANFDGWKLAFNSDPLGRAQHGVTRHAIYRTADTPTVVVVHLQFATRAEAETFMPKLQAMWQRVGGELGFDKGEGVQAHILDEVETIEYAR